MMEESSHGQPPVIGKHRASQQLVGTVVLPSDEDSQAFNVVFTSGDLDFEHDTERFTDLGKLNFLMMVWFQ